MAFLICGINSIDSLPRSRGRIAMQTRDAQAGLHIFSAFIAIHAHPYSKMRVKR
jgi:hypothetical protein